jgi:hypothetical protein
VHARPPAARVAVVEVAAIGPDGSQDAPGEKNDEDHDCRHIYSNAYTVPTVRPLGQIV